MNDNWTNEELEAAIDAYTQMQHMEREGKPFVKKQFYEELAQRYGRTPKSFEYRMQNISYVLALMGRDWLKGLKPARNVGANVAAQIERLLLEHDDLRRPLVAAFEITVRDEAQKKPTSIPIGITKPTKTIAAVTQFQRDPKVKAWVLQMANGVCECCKRVSPFNSADGKPFLEVHHLLQLADGGADTTSNTIAVCPNCHRELHYGLNAKSIVERLYKQIPRLTSVAAIN